MKNIKDVCFHKFKDVLFKISEILKQNMDFTENMNRY